MICLACKKQIPDDSKECPNCGSSIDHQLQVVHEIKFRRMQRWIFYTVIILLFLGMIGAIGWIYDQNNKLVADITGTKNILDDAQKNLTAKESELGGVKNELSAKDQQYQEINAKAGALEKDKSQQGDELKKLTEEKNKASNDFKQCGSDLFLASANVYGMISKLGKKLSVIDLNKIPLDLTGLSGKDSDQDGLPDEFEAVIGTDADASDTDGDNHSDKDELAGNFNPKGAGSLPINMAFANKYKGSIVVQANSPSTAWYVGNDGKRFFLGEASNGYEFMRSLDFWVSDFKKISTTTVSGPAQTTVPTQRDNTRITDIKKIQTALELYFNDNNKYPKSMIVEDGINKYLASLPQAPEPQDGSCTKEQNQYSYKPSADQSSYKITYCLGVEVAGISAGFHSATPTTIAE